DRYFAVNVDETRVLLDTLAAAGVWNVIYSSSAAVYATQDTPLTETDPLDPQSPYARSKWMVEQQLAARADTGMRSVIFRYFNAAGGHPTGDIGESHWPETHLIPSILDVAVGRRKMLTLWGTTHPTADGTCIRDYVHVSDVAQAHVMAVHHLMAGGVSQTFNVGAGVGYSVKAVIDAAEFVVGHLIPITEGPPRPGDVPSLVADTTRINQWGWMPRRSDLHTMIADAWQWRGRSNPVLDR
ncbi:UDP-glucose 4-epimerase GalE, partial [bacterium]|nr:UDP-glucose 4-epimerase GalE [bacterium]